MAGAAVGLLFGIVMFVIGMLLIVGKKQLGMKDDDPNFKTVHNAGIIFVSISQLIIIVSSLILGVNLATAAAEQAGN
jgi:hypothetical protein